MNDIEFVTLKLQADVIAKRLAHVEVGTGLSQRTMLNIATGKTQPSATSLVALLKHYKKGKK